MSGSINKRKANSHEVDKRKSAEVVPKTGPESPMMSADAAFLLATGGEKKVISRASWFNALARNEIPNVRLGRRFLIPRHAFMQWLQGQRGAA